MFAIGVSTLGYGFPLSVPDGRACPREGRARRLLACDEERPEWRCRSDHEQECDTSSAMPIATLILLRHGQSEWNGPEARFTGWCDVPLTVKGRVEAVSVGQLLRSRGFRAARVDVAFTSELQRAHESCELALASMAGHEQNTWSSERIRRDARLNERHYGAVQGLYKDDPELRAAYGDEEIRRWRRSMLARPPPLDETHPEWRPPPAPLTESLADCQRCEACKPTSQGLHAATRLQDVGTVSARRPPP